MSHSFTCCQRLQPDLITYEMNFKVYWVFCDKGCYSYCFTSGNSAIMLSGGVKVVPGRGIRGARGTTGTIMGTIIGSGSFSNSAVNLTSL